MDTADSLNAYAGAPEDAASAEERIPVRKSVSSKRYEVLDHKVGLIDDFNFSPREFYRLVRQNLLRRQVPDLLESEVQLHEGTPFSRKRLYLQLRRERLVFEICAAPFGTGFFVSSRFFDCRRQAHWWHWAGTIVLILFMWAHYAYKFGGPWGFVLANLTVATVWSVMRLGKTPNIRWAWLDEFLSELPLLGPVYETIFHPDTFYRQDQNAMYLEAVQRTVQESLDSVTGGKGLKLHTVPQHTASKPVMKNLL